MRRTFFLLAALSVGFTLSACGGDDEAFTEENFADKLVDENVLEREAADCVASTLFDSLSEDQVAELEGFSLTSDDEPSPEIQEALTNAVTDCVAGQ